MSSDARVAGMSCGPVSLTMIRCVLVLGQSFTLNVNFVKVSQDMFNALNRALLNPTAFANEMMRIGNIRVAASIMSMSRSGTLAYSGQLRQIAVEHFTGGLIFDD